ncbi:MAG: VIT1/CCC1 transporter family protein, partial [Dehalococcoidia bacterium]
SEEARERWEVEHMREQELAETRHIFRLKGITGPLLDEVVAAVSRDHDQWVKLMMTEELGFPDEPPQPAIAALVMGIAFAVAAAFPVAPFLFLEGTAALIASLGFTGVALFLVAGWRAYLTGGAILRKSVEMVVLAAIAVVVANGIGRLVGVNL